MKVCFFRSEWQVLFIPTFGIVISGDGVYLTLAFLCWGISVRIGD